MDNGRVGEGGGGHNRGFQSLACIISWFVKLLEALRRCRQLCVVNACGLAGHGFCFSILGMNLFGCKFCHMDNGKQKCDRKNFDSLLWALITVFQVFPSFYCRVEGEHLEAFYLLTQLYRMWRYHKRYENMFNTELLEQNHIEHSMEHACTWCLSYLLTSPKVFTSYPHRFQYTLVYTIQTEVTRAHRLCVRCAARLTVDQINNTTASKEFHKFMAAWYLMIGLKG